MDKTRSTITYALPCLAALLLYSEPADLPSQTPGTPLNRYGGNLQDRPIPYRIADRPNQQVDREIAALFAPTRHPPLIADRPPELDLYNLYKQSRASKPKSPVIIRIDQTRQRLSVHVRGKTVAGLESVRVSTGLPGKATQTPDGIYSPRAMAVRRQSYYATRLLKRPVYLTHAIQIVDGIFMHDASPGAMGYLGRKRSHGCVRVDRKQMPRIFQLVKQYRADTRIHIFHSTDQDRTPGTLATTSGPDGQETH
jgi:lipoprotein-anchoring transpeptidase ErfK/SrfK